MCKTEAIMLIEEKCVSTVGTPNGNFRDANKQLPYSAQGFRFRRRRLALKCWWGVNATVSFLFVLQAIVMQESILTHNSVNKIWTQLFSGLRLCAYISSEPKSTGEKKLSITRKSTPPYESFLKLIKYLSLGVLTCVEKILRQLAQWLWRLKERPRCPRSIHHSYQIRWTSTLHLAQMKAKKIMTDIPCFPSCGYF